jgi:hypothetical protein
MLLMLIAGMCIADLYTGSTRMATRTSAHPGVGIAPSADIDQTHRPPVP